MLARAFPHRLSARRAHTMMIVCPWGVVCCAVVWLTAGKEVSAALRVLAGGERNSGKSDPSKWHVMLKWNVTLL